MASSHFCHILYLRLESLDPAHTPEKRITQGSKYQKEHWFVESFWRLWATNTLQVHDARTVLVHAMANHLKNLQLSKVFLWPQGHAWLTGGTDQSTGEVLSPGTELNL